MLYCRTCGQCKYISDENFIENAYISGTETRYVDCVNGEVVDYGDTDTDTTGDSNTYCPHCDSEDIDFEWDVDEEEGKDISSDQREHYEKRQNERRAEMAKQELAYKIKNSDWDLGSN